MTTIPPLVLCEVGETGLEGLESFSPFCMKVHRALRAAGLPYQRRHGARPDSHRALNPTGQVPVLLVGGEPVFDSTRIVARISTLGRSLEGGPTARERADAGLWEELADTALNGFVVAARWADGRNWPAVRDTFFAGAPALVRAIVSSRVRADIVRSLVARDVWRAGEVECWRRFDDLLERLDARAPERGWWVGDRLSVADLALFAQLRSLRTELTPWQASRIEAHPALRAWMDRVDDATGEGTVGLAA